MGLINDIKKEWTREGIKKSLREDWPTILAIAVAGFTTPIVVKRMGWQDSNLAFFFVNALLLLLVGVVIGIGKRFKRKIKA